ncbi:MAG: GntR family transcriptional regulator, partial [Sphaerochaetaceae bacterium]|nr:GntR family transcriptional regulator [Sphaerochaetaceae bacterium]
MKENLVEKAYQLISEMIFRYQLAPGAKVSDYSLSKDLGISRTPIREALQILVADELLEFDGSKYKVPEITIERVDSIYDARLQIQVGIIKLAMEKGVSQENLSYLRSELKKEAESLAAGNIHESISHDLEFNRSLCLLCKNPYLIKYY